MAAYDLPDPAASILAKVFHSKLAELWVEVDGVSVEGRRSSTAWLLGLTKRNLVSGLGKLKIRSVYLALRIDKKIIKGLARSTYLGNLESLILVCMGFDQQISIGFGKVIPMLPFLKRVSLISCSFYGYPGQVITESNSLKHFHFGNIDMGKPGDVFHIARGLEGIYSPQLNDVNIYFNSWCLYSPSRLLAFKYLLTVAGKRFIISLNRSDIEQVVGEKYAAKFRYLEA